MMAAAKRKKSPQKAEQLEPTTAGCYHVPVLLQESVEALVQDPNGIYIDVTFGGGGHSRAILQALGNEGHLFGFDRDLDAMDNVPREEERFTFVRSDFRYIRRFLDYYGVAQVDGILADLGVSSHHFDDEDRGFSFRFDAPLDMRMNRAGGPTAADLIASTTQEELACILGGYGEAKGAGRIAARLCTRVQEHGRIETVGELIDAIAPVCPPHDKKNLARVFQGLRIAVNDEMGALRSLLEASAELLRPGGRLVVITYHSLEDRPVKNFVRTGNIEGERITDTFGVPICPMTPLGGKPITPSAEEVDRNPRARSAKLRVGVRK